MTKKEREILRQEVYPLMVAFHEASPDTAAERFAVEKLKHAAAAFEEALIELDREEGASG